MIKVLVSGCEGRMGSLVASTVLEQPDMQLAGGYDPASAGGPGASAGASAAGFARYSDLACALEQAAPDCVVDFSLPSAVEQNIRTVIGQGISCIVGTTGLSAARLSALADELFDGQLGAVSGPALFVAPNFTIGAVLMMRFAEAASVYFPDVEVLEFHHNRKADAPSGTAVNTAERMAKARQQASVSSKSPGAATELPGLNGARGAMVETIPIHAIRSDAFMASQEVIFGSPGQKLVIRHDSNDRNAYMPGVMLAIRKIKSLSGLVVGLEKIME